MKSASSWSGTLILRVKSAWPKLSKDTAALYAGYFERWEKSHGKQRVEDAIETAIGQYGEVPSLSALRDLLAQSLAADRPERTWCGQCSNGWVRVYEGKTLGGGNVDPKIGAMRACECRRAKR